MCRWCNHMRRQHFGNKILGKGEKCTVPYCTCVYFTRKQES